KLPREKTEQFISLALSLKNERSACGIAILCQQLKQQRRLAQPRSSEKDGKAEVQFDGLNHRLQRSTMPFGREEECRIWRNPKRRLVKSKVPEKIFILLFGICRRRNRQGPSLCAVFYAGWKH